MEKKVSKKDTNEKEKVETKEEVIEANKKNKLTDEQKEIIITIIVLILSVAVGFFIGKYLFEALYG